MRLPLSILPRAGEQREIAAVEADPVELVEVRVAVLATDGAEPHHADALATTNQPATLGKAAAQTQQGRQLTSAASSSNPTISSTTQLPEVRAAISPLVPSTR